MMTSSPGGQKQAAVPRWPSGLPGENSAAHQLPVLEQLPGTGRHRCLYANLPVPVGAVVKRRSERQVAPRILIRRLQEPAIYQRMAVQQEMMPARLDALDELADDLVYFKHEEARARRPHGAS